MREHSPAFSSDSDAHSCSAPCWLRRSIEQRKVRLTATPKSRLPPTKLFAIKRLSSNIEMGDSTCLDLFAEAY